jgi:hypothetical protein
MSKLKHYGLVPATYRSTRALLCGAVCALLGSSRSEPVLHDVASRHSLDRPKTHDPVGLEQRPDRAAHRHVVVV